MARLYAPIAIPGAGKSHLARAAVEAGLFPPTAIVATDEIRRMIADDHTVQANNTTVFDVFHTIIRARLRTGVDTYADATNLTAQSRQALYKIAVETRATLVWVRFYTPTATCRERNRARGEAAVPEPAMGKMIRQLGEIAWDELPGNIVAAGTLLPPC